MPSTSEKMRRFMGKQLGDKRAGRATEVDMSEKQLSDFAKKPVEHHGRHKTSEHAPHGRKPNGRGY